jgi:hypothetical protein
MNKFLAFAALGALAITASVATTSQSEAFFPKYGFGAGVVGFIAGAALVSAADHDRWYHDDYYGGPGWDYHVQACEAQFGWRYDPHTNLVHEYGNVFECHV